MKQYIELCQCVIDEGEWIKNILNISSLFD